MGRKTRSSVFKNSFERTPLATISIRQQLLCLVTVKMTRNSLTWATAVDSVRELQVHDVFFPRALQCPETHSPPPKANPSCNSS